VEPEPVTEAFVLDPRLAANTVLIRDLALCRVLLMNERRYPWLLLVPRRPNLAELIDLDDAGRHRLLEEIAAASRALKTMAGVEKLNIAALGNIVRQLHIHVIGRNSADPNWPRTVWDKGDLVHYDDAALHETAARIGAAIDRQPQARRRNGP
jgi:diadenosine tetraphosphate (Ap4A) HIT family hydrolase